MRGEGIVDGFCMGDVLDTCGYMGCDCCWTEAAGTGGSMMLEIAGDALALKAVPGDMVWAGGLKELCEGIAGV